MNAGDRPKPAPGTADTIAQRLPLHRARWIVWVAMMIVVVIVAALNSRFLWIPIPQIMHRAVDHLGRQDLELYLHLSTAPLIVILGGVCFMPSLRIRKPAVHRWVGRIYLTLVILTAPATLRLALTETEGPLTVFGFGTLSVLWFATAILTGWHAIGGRFQEHSEWAVRNYALTLTNVTFRAELHIALLFGVQFDTVYEPLRALQFIPNLIVAELLIRNGALTAVGWSELGKRSWRERSQTAITAPSSASAEESSMG